MIFARCGQGNRKFTDLLLRALRVSCAQRLANELRATLYFSRSLIAECSNFTRRERAQIAAMSERTFSRQFIRDTGFRFRSWKPRARICVSL